MESGEGKSYKIIKAKDFNENIIKTLDVETRGRKKRGRNYRKIITAFDIETSRIDIDGRLNAFMYVWQWAFDDSLCVMGRTWGEFLDMCERIRDVIGSNIWLVVYVHNLSFEFQFLSGIYQFQPADVFCMDSRKVLKADVMGCLEFRCSYIHSNMSLKEYTYKMDVPHKKLSGEEFDYSVARYPWTPLTEQEQAYCCHDVIGLVEALKKDIAIYNDTLNTFPLTSTGYVRRDARNAMKGGVWVKDIVPDYEVYMLMRKAFRGGNTHANRYYSGIILHDVTSYDRSSSYPDVQVNCLYPVSKFFHEPGADLDRVLKLMYKRGRAVLMKAAFSGIRLKNDLWGFPYLAKDKCPILRGGEYDNGRILSADYLETALTDVDLRIILMEYDFDDIVIFDCYHARYGRQPQRLLDCTIQYYKDKTRLKGVPGQEVYYMKQKNKLNSIYGMEATDPAKRTILFENNTYNFDNSETVKEILEKNNQRAFLSYGWGVWVTAWARYRLEEGLALVYNQGATPIYTDTDSIKYLGEVDWTEYNRKRREDSEKNGAFADDPAGKRHYMGVFEHDATYTDFKTLGAKKYAYHEQGDDHLHVTIAGVNKAKGGKELEKAGGLNAFDEGFIFRDAGGTEAIYNDDTDVTLNIDGHPLHVTKNVAIKDSTYEIGLTADYKRLLTSARLRDNYFERVDFQLKEW